jgi:mannose-6-phosphate isomerase
LSIAKALPVQLHPNKHLAEKLHRDNPDKFTDANHKPEIAIALSQFEVFAGWRPMSDIAPLFDLLPCLKRFVPVPSSSSEGTGTKDDWTDESLRKVILGFLKADQAELAQVESELSGQISTSTSRLDGLGLGHLGHTIQQLLPRIQEQYGKGDPGTLIALLCMNYLVLEAGEALYIPADCIHAYLSGDIVECMARSNNVLNCGFLPPGDRDDPHLFADTLTFAADSKGENVRLPRSDKSDAGRNGRTTAYRPPLSEFDALMVQLEPGQDEHLCGFEGPSMAIVTKGRGTLRSGDDNEKKKEKKFDVDEGSIFFITPGTSIAWAAADSDLEVFQIVI